VKGKVTGTHESTSQLQQVEEQPSALSRDQDVIYKSKLSEEELAALDSVISAQKADFDELASTQMHQDSLLQESTALQLECTSLPNEKNIEAQIFMTQESAEMKSSDHKLLDSDVTQNIKYKDSQEPNSSVCSTLSSKQTDQIYQIIKTKDGQEIRSPVPFSHQNGQSLSPIQAVLSAELTADAGGGGGNRENGLNTQHMEGDNKRLDVHHITDVNKRVADVVSSMASTLESITAAAEGFEGGHGSSDEGEEQLMLMRDSPRWEDEEIQADEHEEPRAIKAEIKLLVKTTELGKESIEIRSIREFVEADDKIKCGFGGIMSSPYPDQIVESSSAGQVTPSGERVYTLQRESIIAHSSSPRFVRLHPTTGSTEESTHDDFDLMAQVRGSSGSQK